jgi:hypothetical protein
MYSKLIRKVCREPLGEIQIEKKGGKTKRKGARCGVEIFQGSLENSSKVKYWRGLFPDP